MRVVLFELNISALSDFQTPRQQMSQFWSEDFAAHILQISSFRTSEDPVSDLILCVRRTSFRLNPYAVRGPYLERASYNKYKCKSRSMEVNR